MFNNVKLKLRKKIYGLVKKNIDNELNEIYSQIEDLKDLITSDSSLKEKYQISIFKKNFEKQWPIRDNYKKLTNEEIKNRLQKWYFNVSGKKLNLENPKTLSEKLQWLKIYDNTPLKTIFADKYLAPY